MYHTGIQKRQIETWEGGGNEAGEDSPVATQMPEGPFWDHSVD